MSGRFRGIAILLAGALVSAVCGAFGGFEAVATPAAPESGYTVEIDDLAPRVVTNQTSVKVSGTVSFAKAQSEATLSVFVRADSMVTVSDAKAYLEDFNYAGDFVAATTLKDVKAGTPTPFSISIPTDDLPFYSPFFWGPRGIEVRAEVEGRVVSDRSLLLWDSGYEVQPLNLSVVSSIAMGVDETDQGVRATNARGGQVRVAQSLAGVEGVTLAVGAGLLEQEDFARSLVKAGAGPVISLPAADADVAGIAHLSQRSQIVQLVQDSKSATNLPVTRGAGLQVLDDFVLPEVEELDRQVVDLWADQTVVSTGQGLAPLDVLTYDPSAWSRYDAQTGSAVNAEEPGTDLLLAHNALSDLLSSSSTSKSDELDVQQMIRSTTAIITRQLPNQSRTVLALTQRNPDSEVTVARVKAALGDRWVNPISVADVKDMSGAPEPRTALPDLVPSAGSITDAEVRSLYEAIESTAAMTSALEDSTGTVAEQRSRVLLATSLALREQPELRSRLIKGVNEEAEALATSVKVEQSAPINLLDRKAHLPVRVSSALDEPVNVVVELVSPDPRLQIEKSVDVSVPARGSSQAEIPVRAIGSGNVAVQVKVKGPNGLVIDDAARLQIRVRAEWESTGTLVFSIALALLLAAGIWRTIRRGRRVDIAEEDASGGLETPHVNEGAPTDLSLGGHDE